MGKGGGEVLLLLGGQLQRGDVPLQLLGHPVELGRQDANLVIGVHIGPDAVVAPGDLPGGPGQIPDGRREHGAEGKARRQAHRHGDEIDHLIGEQILRPQTVQVGHIPAALQKIAPLVHGKAAGHHQLIVLLPLVRHPDDLIIHIFAAAPAGHQAKPVVPKGGDGQGFLESVRRHLGGGAGSPLHRHGAQHGAKQLVFLHRGSDLVLQLGVKHRGNDGVAADAQSQRHNEHHGKGDFGGKLHPSPSSR